MCVGGGVGREDVGRMGKENSGGFVIYRSGEVRWAGPAGEAGCREGLNPPLGPLLPSPPMPDSHIQRGREGKVEEFFMFLFGRRPLDILSL